MAGSRFSRTGARREPVQMMVNRLPPAARGGRLRDALAEWHTQDRKTRVLVRLLAAAASLYGLAVYAGIMARLHGGGAAEANSVFLFWGWSSFIHQVVPASLIYDPRILHHFELGLAGAPRRLLPFAYPPSVLLLIWPLAWLRPVAAFVVWTFAGLALFGWACWQRRRGLTVAWLALVAPGTVMAVYFAQTSLFAAALMIGGCRLTPRRPVLAGVLFGLLAFKPQYGLLVPVALVSARCWRAIAAAVVTLLLTTAASGLAFGWSVWTRLPGALRALSALVARHRSFAHDFPTVTGGLRLLGAGPGLTEVAQLAAAIGAGTAIFLVFRRGFAPLPVAALLVGAFFATPYASVYDLPIVSYAVLAVVRERHDSGDPFGPAEILVLVLGIAAPFVIALSSVPVPWGPIILLSLFGLIMRRIVAIHGRSAEVRP